MIELKQVSKTYGQTQAVKNVSFKVEKGDIVGLLGRNGAGKSTTMNMLTGYIPITQGTITIDGYDITANPSEAKRKIGYLPEQPPLYLDLTVEEYLTFACRLKDVKKSDIKKHVDEALEAAKITDVKKRLIGNLSKGYRQRVGLAQALCGKPEVIILDEPTAGLDPKQIIDIRKTIKELGSAHTVILSSHILSEVADICEKVVIINRGEIVTQDTIANLTGQSGGIKRTLVRLTGSEEAGRKALQIADVKIECAGQNEPDTTDFIVESGERDVREDIYDAVKHSGVKLLVLKPLSQTLEDIFIEITSRGEEQA